MTVVAACASGADPASPSDEVPPTAGETTPTGSNPTPIISHGGQVDDYVILVDGLRAVGATVVPAGTVSQPFFTP